MDHFQTYWNLFIGRTNDFAQQRPNGGYWRRGRSLTRTDLAQHLRGDWTLGTYVRNEQGQCSFAVYDADQEDGLQVLHTLQEHLAHEGIPSSLERSRRGGHLWVFFVEPVPASQVRAWLLPWCPTGVEFYPKQAEGAGYGSLIRLPLGVHLRSGKRYLFVEWRDGGPVPVARSVPETLAWLPTIQRATVPLVPTPPTQPPRLQHTSFSSSQTDTSPAFPTTIQDWCASQDPSRVIGAHVALNSQGIGQCPFLWHHAHGDTRPSFKVYTPGRPGGYCWYCYTWEQGGSVFDFLRYWHNLEPREMWKRIQEESKANR